MKKYTDTLREYVRRLNDEDLKYIGTRFTQRLGGDVGEAVELIQRQQDMDRWLSSAHSADVFFDMVDQIDTCVQQEMKKRFGVHEQKEKSKAAAAAAASGAEKR